MSESAEAVEYTDYFSAKGQNQCPGYDTKQSDGEVPVILELREMLSTSSLPSLPGSLRPGMVTPDGVLSMGLIKLNCVLILNWMS